MNDNIVKAGTLLCVDKGQYSDYTLIGFFVVLKDFDPIEKLEEYLADKPEQRNHYFFIGEQFLAVLLSQGFLLEIQYSTLFLSAYGDPKNVALRHHET